MAICTRWTGTWKGSRARQGPPGEGEAEAVELDPILWDWLSYAVRWLHVIAAVAWIGASFYFIALDLSLKKHDGLPDGVGGDTWQVHGGGFYHMQKCLVAPAAMPEQLTWFKWESYATWLSGFAMLAVVYYAGAELYLIDTGVMALEPWQVIGLSVLALALGWAVYDGLCRAFVGRDQLAFAILFAFFIALTWAFTLVFSGRGAFVHAGAVIMTANVFMVIIPGQKKIVAALLAGGSPDPALGARAKQRSTHNNYLTLPVIFLMLSVHYPLAFATRWNWLIVAFVLVIGVVVRHFFNNLHAGRARPWWTWAVAAAAFAAIVWLSTYPPHEASDEAVVAVPDFEAVREIVEVRCALCHAAEPGWEGFATAPRDVRLESDGEIRVHAREIYLHAARSHAMPPGNITDLSAAERRQLAAWFDAGAR